MISYIGYLVSNLILTFLAVYLLGGFDKADILTLMLALVAAGAGVTQSWVGSVLLKIKCAKAEGSLFLLDHQSFYLGLILSAFSSMLTAVVAGYVLASVTLYLANVVAEDLVYGGSFYFLSAISGVSAFLQTYMQRMGAIGAYYKHFTTATLVVVIILIALFYLGEEVGVLLCVLMFCIRGGVSALLSFIFCISYFRVASMEMTRIKYEYKKLLPLLVSGGVAKLNAPFDRAILMLIGDGYSTIYHFVVILMGAAARYFDVNVMYVYYLKRREKFNSFRKLAFSSVPFIFLVWVLIYLYLVLIDISFFSRGVALEFNSGSLLMLLGMVFLSLYMIIPMVFSASTNSLFVLFFYERDMSFYIAKISIVSACIAYIMKIILIFNNILFLVPVVLNMQFFIMILIMARKYIKFKAHG